VVINNEKLIRRHTAEEIVVHTIKEAIYECHVETKELNDWLVYEEFEGANETFTEYGLPTAQDIRMR